jgi:hypothetical protein
LLISEGKTSGTLAADRSGMVGEKWPEGEYTIREAISLDGESNCEIGNP